MSFTQFKFPLKLTWDHGPYLPFVMSRYIQSVVTEGRLYVGGGSRNFSDRIVMEYNGREWATLPPYAMVSFAMTAIANQLVLVGGWEYAGYSKVLGVWGADHKAWTHPYPDMPTARSRSSVAVYKEWLVVAGGQSGQGILSSVEVLKASIGVMDLKHQFLGMA